MRCMDCTTSSMYPYKLPSVNIRKGHKSHGHTTLNFKYTRENEICKYLIINTIYIVYMNLNSKFIVM